MDERYQLIIDDLKVLAVGEPKKLTGVSAKMVIDAVAMLNECHNRGHEIFQGINYSIVTRVK